MTTNILWFISWGLIFIFFTCTLGNDGRLIAWLITGNRNQGSMVTAIGGICGMIACFTLPMEGTAKWFFLPLILDAGCLPLLINEYIHWRRREKLKNNNEGKSKR